MAIGDGEFEGMYGPQYAKKYVTDYLTEDIPKRLIKYRNYWGISNADIPDPEQIIGYEPMALDRWPAIITVSISAQRFERISYTSLGDPEYSITYQMRTYVWARTEGPEETTVMRDRYIVVVRSALMDHPCFKRFNVERTAVLDESSLNEQYSELTVLKGDRFLGGGYIGYDLKIEEAVVREKIADLDKIEVLHQNVKIGENLT